MSASKSLSGKLSIPITKTNYTGKSTDSLKINVDNKNMTISGDVIWSDILGTTPDKAYPGNLGARNYEQIQLLTKTLTEKVTELSSVDTELKSQLVLNVNSVTNCLNQLALVNNNITSLSNNYRELYSRLESEITRALKAEEDLSKLIDEKLKNNTESINLLKNDVTKLKTDLLDLRNTLTLINNQLSTHTSAINQLQKATESLPQIHQTLESHGTKLAEFDQLNIEFKKLTTDLVSKETAVTTTLSALTEQLNAEIARAQHADNTRLQVDKDHEIALQAHERQLNELLAALQLGQTAITGISKTLEDVKKEHSELNSRADTIWNSVEEVRSDLIRRMATLEISVNNLLAENESKMGDIETEFNEVKNQFDELKTYVEDTYDALGTVILNQIIPFLPNRISITKVDEENTLKYLFSLAVYDENEGSTSIIEGSTIELNLTDILTRIGEAEKNIEDTIQPALDKLDENINKIGTDLTTEDTLLKELKDSIDSNTGDIKDNKDSIDIIGTGLDKGLLKQLDDKITTNNTNTNQSIEDLNTLIDQFHPIQFNSLKIEREIGSVNLTNVIKEIGEDLLDDALRVIFSTNKPCKNSKAKEIKLTGNFYDGKPQIKENFSLEYSESGDTINKTYVSSTIDSRSVLGRVANDEWAQSNPRPSSLTVEVIIEDNNIQTTKSATITYTYPVYYGAYIGGALPIEDLIESGSIPSGKLVDDLNLTKVLQTSRMRSKQTYHLDNDEYFYYIVPVCYGEPIFSVGIGLEEYIKQDPINLKINGLDYEYNIYRSNNHSLGDFELEIK